MTKRQWLTAWLLTTGAAVFALSACDKTSKTSSAGGGSSTQSVLAIKGATR